MASGWTQPGDFLAESEALAALLEPLDDAGFERKTQFKDWTLRDVVAHLHMFNYAADLSLRSREEFQAWWAPLSARVREGTSLQVLADERFDGVGGRQLFEEWKAFCPVMAANFDAVDPKLRVAWAGPDMSARSSVTARLMETWAHGQEVYDLLGVVREDRDRIKNIAILGVNTFGWTFAVRGQEAPAPVPRIRLEAPSGALWEWNEEVESDLVEGSASEFCQVVTQVRNLADTKLRVEGPVAERWMSIAQCFAGPPEEPPPPGARFTAPRA